MFCKILVWFGQALPDVAANSLLSYLLSQRRISAPQLALFESCVTSMRLNASCGTGTEWLSYVGGYRCAM
jgi:hypothetical protein